MGGTPTTPGQTGPDATAKYGFPGARA